MCSAVEIATNFVSLLVSNPLGTGVILLFVYFTVAYLVDARERRAARRASDSRITSMMRESK